MKEIQDAVEKKANMIEQKLEEKDLKGEPIISELDSPLSKKEEVNSQNGQIVLYGDKPLLNVEDLDKLSVASDDEEIN